MPKAKTKREKEMDRLEALAEEIGEAGAADDANVSDMRKAANEMLEGFKDAVGEVLAMVKGSRGEAPPDEDDEPPARGSRNNRGAPPDDDDDDRQERPPARGSRPQSRNDEPDDEDEDNDSGFRDMRQGRRGEVEDEDVFVDTEKLLRNLDAMTRRDNRAIRRLQSTFERMTKAVERSNQLAEQNLLTQAKFAAPMMKSVAALGDAIAEIPQASIVQGRHIRSVSPFGRLTPDDGGHQAPTHAAGAGRRTGAPKNATELPDAQRLGRLGNMDEISAKRTMLKAVGKGAISSDELALFDQVGVFHADAAVHLAKIAEIEKQIG